MVYFHHALFSSGVHGGDAHIPGWAKPLWDALYAADADVIVNGHDHDYGRFAPQTPSGVADPARGIREFVVGTDDTSLRVLVTDKDNSEIKNSKYATFYAALAALHGKRIMARVTRTKTGSPNCLEYGTIGPVAEDKNAA